MTRLFVYGTLMRGQCRESVLKEATFLHPAETEPLYRLVDLGDYPGLVAGDRAIEGELYDVPAALWPTLDAVEAVDEGLYERNPVRLRGSKTATTYLYLGDTAGRPDCGRRWPPDGS